MRTLIGLVIILLIVLGIVWYVQKDSSFISRLVKRDSVSQEASPTVTPESAQIDGNGAVITPTQQVTQVMTCTPELVAMDCTAAGAPVCSMDTVVRLDGSEESVRTEYISACHYCKFFGADNTAEFGDEKVTTQGYTNGACAVSGEKGTN